MVVDTDVQMCTHIYKKIMCCFLVFVIGIGIGKNINIK